MKEGLAFYGETPPFLRELAETPPMRRLAGVGMNCGCEYTCFERFRRLKPYSRLEHSMGAARIVWHFTSDRVQSAAALFHDIATPSFAHSVDFLRGDALRQEATESGTAELIRGSAEIGSILQRLQIPVEDVLDYHRYPIADNDAPRLSADRLEYTLGNLLNYGFCSLSTLQAYYDDLCVVTAEDGKPELAFSDLRLCSDFGRDALRCSRVYVSDEDRYAMQSLAELLDRAIGRGVLRSEDLYLTEDYVIGKLLSEESSRRDWEAFRRLNRMVREEREAPAEKRRVIRAKKRCIDPYVAGQGRLSALDPDFSREISAFLAEAQDQWLYGV